MKTSVEKDGIEKQVRENLKKLEGCSGPHDFAPVGKTAWFRCSLCGGEVNGVVRNWYVRGLNHGRKMRE